MRHGAAERAQAIEGLNKQRRALDVLTAQITQQQRDLTAYLATAEAAIDALKREARFLARDVEHRTSLLSPLRLMPDELLREVFLWNFAVYPCCGWVLASVCRSWRRLALHLPTLWSKIRLLTNQNASADTIRLWIERSGRNVPLDIEIFLRVTAPSSPQPGSPVRSMVRTTPYVHVLPPLVDPSQLSPQAWPYMSGGVVQVTHSVSQSGTVMQVLPPISPLLSPTAHHVHSPWTTPPPSRSASAAGNQAWGYVAMFYLVEQMHRWERFVFRFDKQFAGVGALRTIAGPAPLLQEFEVSCAEPTFGQEWTWLPSAAPNAPMVLPNLRALTLQYAPFKWTSPMLRQGDLTSLSLRALPSIHLPLDRILAIITSNPNLTHLSLHFAAVLAPILPLAPTRLEEVRELSMGGHYLLASLLDTLILPSLDALSLDIEPRDSFEDTLLNLLVRSGRPPLSRLSLALASPGGFYGHTPLFGGSAGGGQGLPWSFLNDWPSITSLSVSGTQLEPLIGALSAPDDEQPHWLLPNLTVLGLRGCHHHHHHGLSMGADGASKLVQMVDARNPPTGAQGIAANGLVPKRLEALELNECAATLGEDVMEWLRTRVDDVRCPGANAGAGADGGAGGHGAGCVGGERWVEIPIVSA